MKISRVLHAGYIVEFEGIKILFDPLFESPFSVNCYAYPHVEFDNTMIRQLRFDAVIISHYHDDHCSLASLDLIDKATPIFLFCVFDELFDIIQSLGFEKVHPIKLNQIMEFGELQIIPLPALDEDVDSLFHIKAGHLNVLNVVDSWIGPSTFRYLKKINWDLILWPFQTMCELEVLSPQDLASISREIPLETREQLAALKPRYLVPSSCQFIFEEWSWYNKIFFPISYKIFADQIKSILPQTQITRMDPGVSFLLSKEGLKQLAALSWINPVGHQEVDYIFDTTIAIPGTSEIAKNFKALTVEQKKLVLNFCENEMPRKYAELGQIDHEPVRAPVLWRLSLFEESGEEIRIEYQVSSHEMILAKKTGKLTEFVTEIPLSKLFAALELGESLTSLYVRIKKSPFDDVLNDPLLRCLYSDRFACYQKAQLQNLSGSRSRAVRQFPIG